MTVTLTKLFVGVSFIAVLVLANLVMPRVPVPTADIRPTETQVAFKNSPSPTVSVPTAVSTATGTPVPTATATPSPVPKGNGIARSLPGTTWTPLADKKASPSATRTMDVTATPPQTALPNDSNRPSPSPSSPATPAVTSTLEAAALIPAKQAYNHNYVIKEDYDNAKDQTTFSLEERPQDITAVPNTLFVTYAVPGTQGAIPKSVAVSFFSTSESWQFLSLKSIALRLDGTELLYWEVTERGAASGGSVTELLTASVPVMDFLRVVNSERVEVQIGPYYFELTNEQMQALKDLASRMAP